MVITVSHVRAHGRRRFDSGPRRVMTPVKPDTPAASAENIRETPPRGAENPFAFDQAPQPTPLGYH